jgi:hypothetical protein
MNKGGKINYEKVERNTKFNPKTNPTPSVIVQITSLQDGTFSNRIPCNAKKH